jgi:hypothetical protein
MERQRGSALPGGAFELIIVMGLAQAALGQMSPGELSRAHQDLDGPLSCGKCHSFGQGTVQFKCLECHEEIKKKLEEKRGYHARVVRGGVGSQDCARCHAEHNGRNHRFVRWPVAKERFDHAQAGWVLQGKHARLTCEQCHTPKNIPAEMRNAMKRKNLSASFAGLETNCTACHTDTHRGQLGDDCARCHGMETWKKPPGFSHDRTRYPLSGKHEDVECAKCHKPIATLGAQIQYRGFTFYENCGSCHRDPHGGALRGDCQHCHTAADWKAAKLSGGFDHSKTKFPLQGRHAAVACRQCHKTENFGAPVAHARCLDCHKDEHGGQFLSRADRGDCGSCHDERSYKPARYGKEEHAASKYPLAGKHGEVECSKCHEPHGRATRYLVAHESCRDCHRDTHRNQFAAAPFENRCEQCHAVAGFKPSTFTLARHNQTQFGLHGAHAAVPCTECHKPAGRDAAYHVGSLSCQQCHRDPHGPMAVAASCEACHTTRNWREQASFDHGATKFTLIGKHRGAECLKCHKPAGPADHRTIAFAGTPEACTACHEDGHGGQFLALNGKPECARCHTTINWSPTGFDHDRHSTFSLAGAHARVPCRLCHERRKQADGRIAAQYRGTPRVCLECHR